AANGHLSYHPMLLGAAQIHYTDSTTIDLMLLAEISDGPITLDWNNATPISVPLDDLQSEPEQQADYGEVPPTATKQKAYAAWSKDFATWIYRNHRLELFESPNLE